MPNRILRDGVLSSEAVCGLGWAAEVLYRRLMSVVDDYGRFSASTKLIRAACYPLQIDKVSDSDIGKWLAQVAEAGLVRVYPAQDGKSYLEIQKFGQQIRSKSKFPGPDECVQASASNCSQPPANAHLDVFVFEDVSEEVKGARKRSQPFDPAAMELPEWLDRELWVAWCEDRKARKKPISERGASMQISKLDEYRQQGTSPKAVIEHSIAGGYQGLFAPASNRQQPQASSPAESSAVSNKAVEMTRQMLAEQSSIKPNPEKAREALQALQKRLIA